jgi:uncharacterized membrane protein
MATVLIVSVYLVLAMGIAAVVVIGLVRGRRHLRWRTPGYNMFTARWSDDVEQDGKRGR